MGWGVFMGRMGTMGRMGIMGTMGIKMEKNDGLVF
jgi:hypothetical protein